MGLVEASEGIGLEEGIHSCNGAFGELLARVEIGLADIEDLQDVVFGDAGATEEHSIEEFDDIEFGRDGFDFSEVGCHFEDVIAELREEITA
jgi:hypothetical protein